MVFRKRPLLYECGSPSRIDAGSRIMELNNLQSPYLQNKLLAVFNPPPPSLACGVDFVARLTRCNPMYGRLDPMRASNPHSAALLARNHYQKDCMDYFTGLDELFQFHGTLICLAGQSLSCGVLPRRLLFTWFAQAMQHHADCCHCAGCRHGTWTWKNRLMVTDFLSGPHVDFQWRPCTPVSSFAFIGTTRARYCQ